MTGSAAHLGALRLPSSPGNRPLPGIAVSTLESEARLSGGVLQNTSELCLGISGKMAGIKRPVGAGPGGIAEPPQGRTLERYNIW